MPNYDFKLPSNPGLKVSPIDPRNAQYEAIFASGEVVAEDSKNWMPQMPPFRYQGWYPLCTTYQMGAVIHAVNKAFDFKTPIISPAWLFFKSNGSRTGNTLEAVAQTARELGAVMEYDKKTPTGNEWSWNKWEELKTYSLDVQPDDLIRAVDNKIKSYSFISTENIDAQVSALEFSPLGLAVPVYEGYFDAMNGWKARDNPPWHAVAVTQRFTSGVLRVFDSLTVTKDFDGFHDLPPDYPHSWFMSYRDLPTGWQEKQKTWLEMQYPNAYVQYGQKRLSLADEQIAAQKLRQEIDKHKNMEVSQIGSRFWVVFVNAYIYGGYTIVDIVNSIYHYRRTGNFPLNFDQVRG